MTRNNKTRIGDDGEYPFDMAVPKSKPPVYNRQRKYSLPSDEFNWFGVVLRLTLVVFVGLVVVSMFFFAALLILS